jgi:hypothetical protein
MRCEMTVKIYYRISLVLLSVWLWSACGTESAQDIVDKSIAAHGGEAYKKFYAEFDFRDKHYTIKRNEGEYVYTRSFADSTGRYFDELTNQGFKRLRNDTLMILAEDKVKAFTNSVNSVSYFALLPFGLNDPAVVKKSIGKTSLEGEPYHLIEVSFEQAGGGTDFEDTFLYWVHASSYTVDYIAYSYQTNGGGLRFRKAYHPQVVNGIRFQDYINYKPMDEKNTKLQELAALYTNKQLEELSRIEVKNLVVTTDQ